MLIWSFKLQNILRSTILSDMNRRQIPSSSEHGPMGQSKIQTFVVRRRFETTTRNSHTRIQWRQRPICTHASHEDLAVSSKNDILYDRRPRLRTEWTNSRENTSTHARRGLQTNRRVSLTCARINARGFALRYVRAITRYWTVTSAVEKSGSVVQLL